ncbi:RICIN domain-containing protein [Krasilnikovia sp. MM14-A1259]|uniref:RICIN domain-containing protein n=1 Tax=Krasilnikovia sp. MM14-A1259 TaxID=3373539 RepID=UPI00380AEACD
MRWSGPREDGERGSLPLALLLTTIGLAATAAMVPVVVRQVGSTRTVSERTDAMESARTGVDVALAQLRGAIDVTKAGAPEALPPCLMAGTNPDGTKYKVTITYFDESGTAMPCPPLDVPTTAKVVVTGTGDKGASPSQGAKDTRTLETTYTFKTTNVNIDGGNIRLDQPTNPKLCMDVDATTSKKPTVGQAVQMQPCITPLRSDQTFAYTPDLNIKLIGSEIVNPAGLCLDAPVPHKSGDAVTFQPCLGRKARQQWSLDNSSNFQGTSDGVNLDGYCLNLKTAGVAGPLVIGSCGGTANQKVFRPEAAVGAGMASVDTGQLINYQQFSRCLDVTNHDVNMSYMIVWFCKQAPDGNVSWNQRWTMPAISTSLVTPTYGRFRTTGTSSPGVCLRSPRSIAANAYVTVTSCPATPGVVPPELKWIMYGAIDGDKTSSYRIVDVDGHCLTPTDLTVTNPDTHTDGTAKAKVTNCGKSYLQKWNAPPNFDKQTGLSGTNEK